MTGKAHWYGAKEPQRRVRYTVWVGASVEVPGSGNTDELFEFQGHAEECVVALAQAVGKRIVESGSLTPLGRAAVRLATKVIKTGVRR